MPIYTTEQIIEQLKQLATEIVVEDKPGAAIKAEMLRQVAQRLVDKKQ